MITTTPPSAPKGAHSPLLYDYLRKYQEDPTSRVFAPLAEAYRKAGLVDEAIEIAREGLRVHPGFIGGRVALARGLFDKKLFAEVIDELGPIIQDAPDNLVAQRLLAESFLILGRIAEALGCYKMLLYFNPGDPETAKIVSELEAQAYEKGALVLRTDPPPPAEPEPLPDFAVRPAGAALRDAPDLRAAARREKWIRQVEVLQLLLQRVERYRTRVRLS
jgi:tetratricopeptide (TPR) repeat protein